MVMVAGDDREWVVMSENWDRTITVQGEAELCVLPSMLTPVAPALPPEPPVGTIGWVGDTPVMRVLMDGLETAWVGPADEGWRNGWADIADRFVPAVTEREVVEKVCDWYDNEWGTNVAGERIRDHFLDGEAATPRHRAVSSFGDTTCSCGYDGWPCPNGGEQP
jgi:hypothetical protein